MCQTFLTSYTSHSSSATARIRSFADSKTGTTLIHRSAWKQLRHPSALSRPARKRSISFSSWWSTPSTKLLYPITA